MATDVERLVAVLEARTTAFEKAMNKAVGVSNQRARQIESRFQKMNKSLDGIFARSFRGLTAPLAGVGAALGAAELVRLTDTWTDLTSRVNLAAGSMEAGTEVMGRLGEMARRTYSSLEQTTESYIANATALRELGYATDDQLNYTEALNNALVISAAKGDRAAAIQNALAKAMAGGKLAGDDLNTVIQQGGRVAEALAAGLGVGVNQLRALGAAGKITSRDVFRALTSQMERLRKEAEEMPATISDGIQLLRNALLQYVGQADQAAGVSATISQALVIMADNFDKTADVALQLAGVIAGALVGRSLAGMIARLGLAGAALVNFTRAMAAAGTMARLSLAFGGLAAAAGPAGLIIGGAVVASLIAYSHATADAAQATRTYEDALAAVRKTAEETAKTVDDQTAIISEKTRNNLVQAIAEATGEVERLSGEMQSELAAAIALFENLAGMNLVEPEQLQQLRDLKDEFESGKKSAAQVESALYNLANANPRFQNIADGVRVITAALMDAVAASQLLNAQLQVSDNAGSGGADFDRGGRVRARQALEARKEESRLWEQEQTRRANLGKGQLALENEIARVKKQAADDGIRVTDDQIRRIAEANLSGNAARSKEGKKDRSDEYARLAERIRESTAALQAENETLAGINPLINDYGYALEKARIQQELLAAAKKAGIEITPTLEAEIAKLAEGYANATVEAGRLAESQDKVRERAEEMRSLGKDVMSGFINDLRAGKSASEALANALNKVADKLIDMALNSMFDGMGRGSSGGGFLSFLSGMFRERGGPVKKGQPYIVGEKRPELFVPDQDGQILPRVPLPPSPSSHSAGKGGAASHSSVYHIDARGAQLGVGEEIRRALESYDKGRKARLIADLPDLRRRGEV